jgi:hypothetical protein
MVRDIFAVAARFWSDIDALATRLDPADRLAIAGLAITALANRTGDAAQYFLRVAAQAETKRRRAQMEPEAQLCAIHDVSAQRLVRDDARRDRGAVDRMHSGVPYRRQPRQAPHFNSNSFPKRHASSTPTRSHYFRTSRPRNALRAYAMPTSSRSARRRYAITSRNKIRGK